MVNSSACAAAELRREQDSVEDQVRLTGEDVDPLSAAAMRLVVAFSVVALAVNLAFWVYEDALGMKLRRWRRQVNLVHDSSWPKSPRSSKNLKSFVRASIGRVVPHPAECCLRFPVLVRYSLWCLTSALTPLLVNASRQDMGLCRTLVQSVVGGYVLNQSWFIAAHINFHAEFVTNFCQYAFCPETTHYASYVAWYHHYIDPRKFSRNWLLYRVAYEPFCYFMLAITMISTACTSPSLKELNLKPFVIFWGSIAWMHIQAITHEWYHVRLSYRPRYFILRPVSWLFELLERIKIIDTQAHKEHHKNDRHALLDASDFWDMWVPKWVDALTQQYWCWLVVTSQDPYEDPDWCVMPCPPLSMPRHAIMPLLIVRKAVRSSEACMHTLMYSLKQSRCN
eukprot:COSAG01_NODE_656_length_14462_cov_20.440716_8_plen_395_part_00